MRKILILWCCVALNFYASAQQLLKLKSGEGEYNIVRTVGDSLQATGEDEMRFALIIGNRSYKLAPLQNSVNDANDLAALVTSKNFTVTKVIDGTKLEMKNAIREFAEKISSGGVGLFYYSGHGVQLDGENYLVPIDADYEYKEEVPEDCVSVSSILRFMETSKNRLNIIILDACRNTPFKSFSRSGEKGMVRVEAPSGSIVAYSTAPGKTASDGNGRNGLYTSKLLKYLNVPGIKIEDVFKQVRIEVTRESNNLQSPWESNSLMGDFYFNN
ncbi:MAG TPA: caspase family protein [Flavitalea sp.]|nr:caspase family protein [Flavitalea sp.]